MQSSARIVQLPARGQITLPTDFRRKLGLKEGAKVFAIMKASEVMIGID